MASWDVVLAALAKQPFERLESASLKHLYEGGFLGSDYFHEEGG